MYLKNLRPQQGTISTALSVSSGAHLLIETYVIIWYGAGLLKIERSGIVTSICKRGMKGLRENKVYGKKAREGNEKERNGTR